MLTQAYLVAPSLATPLILACHLPTTKGNSHLYVFRMLKQLIAVMLRPISNSSFSVNALRALTYSLPFVLELYISSKVGSCKEDDITGAGNCGFPSCPHIPRGDQGLATRFAQGQGSIPILISFLFL